MDLIAWVVGLGLLVWVANADRKKPRKDDHTQWWT
jgi:hypothetical protein